MTTTEGHPSERPADDEEVRDNEHLDADEVDDDDLDDDEVDDESVDPLAADDDTLAEDDDQDLEIGDDEDDDDEESGNGEAAGRLQDDEGAADSLPPAERQRLLESLAPYWTSFLELVRTEGPKAAEKVGAVIKTAFSPEYRKLTGISLAAILALTLIVIASGSLLTAGSDRPNASDATSQVVDSTATPGVTTTPDGQLVSPPTNPDTGAVVGGANPLESGGNRSRVHVVQQGENLFRIALRYGLAVADVVAYNNTHNPAGRIDNPDLIVIGQQILLPPAPDSPGVTQPTTAQAAPDLSPQPEVPPFPDRLRTNPRTGLANSGWTVDIGQVLPDGRYCANQGDTLSQIAQRF